MTAIAFIAGLALGIIIFGGMGWLSSRYSAEDELEAKPQGGGGPGEERNDA